MSSSIELGKKIPAFIAQSTEGELSLEKFKDKFVVLYFYPKDNTPGCTNEAKDFRDNATEFARLNASIVGVSRDSLRSHENFISKHNLPFTLISDADEKLCNLFGVIKLKNMYGKQVMGIERSTFLIDSQGKLAAQWRGIRVPGHVQEVLQKILTLEEA